MTTPAPSLMLLDGLDFTPPCECCDTEARWVLWLTVTADRPAKVVLACPDHKTAAERHFTTCVGCVACGFRFHAEPLA